MARGCGSGVTRAPRFLSLGLSLHIWKTPDQAILTFWNIPEGFRKQIAPSVPDTGETLSTWWPLERPLQPKNNNKNDSKEGQKPREGMGGKRRLRLGQSKRQRWGQREGKTWRGVLNCLGCVFSFIHSFIHSFNRHLLSTYYVLRPGDMATTVTSTALRRTA